MRAVLLFALSLSACATVDEAPSTTIDTPTPAPAPVDRAVNTNAAIDIGAIRAPTTLKPQPLATIPACSVQVHLARHAPITFEGDIVDELRDVELDLVGPAGLTVAADVGSFSSVELRPRVALRLPAGPATDDPAGASGALFDLGGLVVAGFVNLVLLPVSVPVGLLTNGDLFVLDVPTFTDGMFSDVVLEKALWQQEVERRAAPHSAVLQREADRQARFAPFLKQLQDNARAAPGCVLNDSGHCHLHFAWPTRFVSLTASGLPCAVPPVKTSEHTDDSDDESDDDNTPSPQVTLTLPALPASPAPTILPLPHNPDELRGHGAERTSSRWASSWNTRLEHAAPAFDAATLRGARDIVLDDVDFVCRIKARGNDFDIDGSAPELSIRLAWGFDHDVVGVSFPTIESRTATVGVHGATLQPGEAVKLSVVDIDAFVDDWVGMDIVVFDGRLPLRFSHPQFTAECRAAPTSSSSSSSSPVLPPEQEQDL
jgi:hypothetical protein